MRLLTLLTVITLSSAHAELKLHPLFSDHAVLQSGPKLPIWGWGTAGEEVSVSLASKSAKTKVDEKGKWRVELEPISPGGPHELKVVGSSELTVKDVLVGEVWLGSGQSNMAMRVSSAQDFEKEKAAATLEKIRMFTVEGDTMSATPLETCSGKWLVCSPETVGAMSATLYFFGRDVHSQLKMPVGLINSSTGGTPIESWNSLSAQEAEPALAPLLKTLRSAVIDEAGLKARYEKQMEEWNTAAATARKEGKPVPQKPKDMVSTLKRKADIGGRFNGKIAPLVGYPIRGMLWYQGEANATEERAPYYKYQMATLIQDWRKRWGYPFPVGLVQLPNFEGRGEPWLQVRDAVRETASTGQDVGMAVTIDIGDNKDIHPKNKQMVGHRLAIWAMASAYGQDAMPMGPMYVGHSTQGQEMSLRFIFADQLVLKDGGKGFEVSGADGVWKPAMAHVVGQSVVVYANGVIKPVAARYGWSEVPEVSLYNESGLPASPFQTRKPKPVE